MITFAASPAEVLQGDDQRQRQQTPGDNPSRCFQPAVEEYRASNADAEVVLRADGALYYDGVQPVMAAITGAGISKVNLVALMPETTQ